MTGGPIPPTVEAAKAFGWEGLRVECKTAGHGVSIFPWPLLEKHAGGNVRASLLSFLPRFKCKHCKQPPGSLYLERRAKGKANGPGETELLEIPIPPASAGTSAPPRS